MMKKAKSEVMPATDDKWKAESDFDTLLRAEEVRTDPARLKRAIAAGKPKAKAIRSLDQLQAKIQEHLSDKDEAEEEE